MGGWRYYDGSVVADLGTVTGTLATSSGGVGTDSSGATGIASVNSGAWTFDPAFQYLGTITPILQLGNDGAEDLLFKWLGNEQDWYIALDDSANAWIIGLGTTVGTTEQITLTATAIVINEDAGNYDFRIEASNNANMIVIDAGGDNMGLGSAVVAGAFLTVNGGAQSRAYATGVGFALNIPTDAYTTTDSASGTILVGAVAYFGIGTYNDSGGTSVITDAATVYIEGAMAANGPTLTRTYSLWVDAGESRFDGQLTVGDASASNAIIVFDGNAVDAYLGLEDTGDIFSIGIGSALGTTPVYSFTAVGSVFNEDGGDYDFRIEGGSNANMLVIDSTNSSVAFGATVVDGAAFTFNNLTERTFVTKVGSQIHLPIQTTNYDNGAVTIAVGAAVSLGIQTFTNTTASLTMTDMATLYIEGPPVDGSSVIATNTYALFIDAGNVRIDGTGPHSVGGVPVNYTRLTLTGAFTSLGGSTRAHLLEIGGALTMASADTGDTAKVRIGGSVITQSDDETVNLIATLTVEEPVITDNLGGSSVVTNSATIYVNAAATEATNNYALWVDAGVSRFDASMLIGDTTVNSKMAFGLTINQGASDDEIFTLKSSDVSHPMTDITEADTFFTILKQHVTGGGAEMNTYSGDTSNAVALKVRINITDNGVNDVTTTAAIAPMMFEARVDDDLANFESYAAAGVTGNLFTVADASIVQFLVKENGALAANSTLSEYDDHDDAAIMADYENYRVRNRLQPSFADMKADGGYDRLVALGLVGSIDEQSWNEGERPLFNLTNHANLLSGNVRQRTAVMNALLDVMEENPGFRGKMTAALIARGVGNLARPQQGP